MAERKKVIRLAVVVICALAVSTLAARAAGVAILDTQLSDNGDDDGYADTSETVGLRLTVQNTTAASMGALTLRLANVTPTRSCLIGPSVFVGSLAPGQVKLTDPFTFRVADLDRAALGLGVHDPLWVAFDVTADSPFGDPSVDPTTIVLDLDLNVSGGAGPSLFLEQFEGMTLGAFEVDNIDAGKHSLKATDGYRCQYSDPDRPGSNSHGFACATT